MRWKTWGVYTPDSLNWDSVQLRSMQQSLASASTSITTTPWTIVINWGAKLIELQFVSVDTTQILYLKYNVNAGDAVASNTVFDAWLTAWDILQLWTSWYEEISYRLSSSSWILLSTQSIG